MKLSKHAWKGKTSEEKVCGEVNVVNHIYFEHRGAMC